MRLNQAKWCTLHKRPLVLTYKPEPDESYCVVCPNHFRVEVFTAAGYPRWVATFYRNGYSSSIYG